MQLSGSSCQQIVQSRQKYLVTNSWSKNCQQEELWLYSENVFDSCPQQRYISETVVRKLNSMALRLITVGVKAFGSKKEKVIKIKE